MFMVSAVMESHGEFETWKCHRILVIWKIMEKSWKNVLLKDANCEYDSDFNVGTYNTNERR